MVFDGTFSATGDDNDVLDARGHALFHDVLNLWLVDDGEHFFWLGFGRGQKSRAEASGRQYGFADLAHGCCGMYGRLRDLRCWRSA